MKKTIYATLTMFCLFVVLVTQSPAQETEAPPVEAKTTEQAEEASGSIISVIEAKICEGIIDREPIAPGDVFSRDIPVLFCFSRIESAENSEVKHIWYYQDNPVAEVPLTIGASSGWRTYSSKNISPSDMGNWKVEIVTIEGEPLKTIQFVVN